ncbi:MAG: hypothetical protein ABIE46_00555, partial [Patescibacteria group bacterium]
IKIQTQRKLTLPIFHSSSAKNPAQNSPKTKSGAHGNFLPKPLLCHVRPPNSKKTQPKFVHILAPTNSFAKTSSALFRYLPEDLEGRTPKEKHPFLFQKKFHPRQIRNARSVFLSGLPRLCEAVAERFILAQKKFERML